MRSCRFSLLIMLVVATVLSIVPVTNARAQYPIEIRVDTATIWLGAEDLALNVYLTNTQDTVGSVLLLFYTSTNEFLHFRTPATASVDTAGMLLSGWDRVLVSGPQGGLAKVAAIADTNLVNPIHQIAPQAGDVPLLRLVLEQNDPLFSETGGPTGLWIESGYSFLSIADRFGQSIGITTRIVTDTNYYRCLDWDGDVCNSWQHVQTPPIDSTEITVDTVPIIDTAYIHVVPGYLNLVVPQCGDINGDHISDLTDILEIAGYVFLGGDPPPLTWVGNVDGSPDGVVDLSDLLHLAEAVFLGGPPVDCPEQ